LDTVALPTDGIPSTSSSHHHPAHAPPRITWHAFLGNMFGVFAPPVGIAYAMYELWHRGFDWLYLGLLIGMYLFSGLGVTIGWHRLFTHRAFKTPTWVRATLAIAGSMSVQGPILWWCAQHRVHHQHSDQAGDPHSPHLHGAGDGFLGTLRGAWHAHLGWVFHPDRADLMRYVGDLQREPMLWWIDRLFVLWILLGLAIPTAIAGLVTHSWTGALLGLAWGGAVRVFMVHHITWSINSVCHIWGTSPFGGDHSKNNPIFGVLAFGEGWHNNHHTFPTSARHGLRWWEFDLSYVLIRAMEWVGMASDVKVPAREAIIAKETSAKSGGNPHG
jgi:stearoyl-CoA desaturase (delta-9 desaturase)